MHSRSKSCVIGAAVALAVALATLGSAAIARAVVGFSQDAVMVGDLPVSGRYRASFNNYDEKIVRCHDSPTLPEGTICDQKGYRVARGTLATKLHAYRVKEGIKRFNYYLVDVDIDVVGHSGTSDTAWADVSIGTTNARLVERSDTDSISASGNGCDTLDLTMSGGISIVTAAIDLGHVTFCADQAYFKRTSSGATSTYHAHRLAHINGLSVQRAVKVPAKSKPVFVVRVTIPKDDCTAAKDGLCTKFSNASVTRTYRVGTTG